MKSAQELVVEAKQQVSEVSVEQADAALEQADFVIDVREADEYAAGRIPRAILIPRGLLEFKLSADPKFSDRGLKIVLYCKTSGRAALAACSLQRMGYQNITSIVGGYDGWVAAGKPVEKPEMPHFG